MAGGPWDRIKSGIAKMARASQPAPDYFAFYRAKVAAQSADFSTVDVLPDLAQTVAPRLPPMSAIALRVPIPGAKIQVQTGSFVMVGWDGGDPSKPYAAPLWDTGGGATTITLPVSSPMNLGAASGTDFVALAQSVLNELTAIKTAFSGHTHAAGTLVAGMTAVTGATAAGPTYSPNSVAATLVKAK